MSLPKLDTPTFELKLPSTGDMIQYTPCFKTDYQ
jgi:hypothetical protein